MNILNWVTTCIAEAKMKWNRRAATTVLQLQYNSIVYIMGGTDQQETDDFVGQVLVEANQIIRQKYSGFLALIAPYHDPSLADDLPQLSLIVEATEDKVPGIWFYQGAVQQAIKYDFPLEKGKFSAELLLVWA